MITIDPSKVKAIEAASKVAEAAALLAKSDIVVLRCYEAGTPLPEAWAGCANKTSKIIRGS